MLRTVLAVLAACVLGCASLGPASRPARLLAEARADLAAGGLEAAYDRLAEIRRRHPHSAECREAFPLAAAIFKRSYFQQRYAQPDSRWLRSEPAFMLDWFGSFFGSGAFPQAEAEALFVGMHVGYFRDYLAFAESRPELARFRVSAEDDNGIVESIWAVAVTGDASSSTATPRGSLGSATRAAYPWTP
jgi:hypothetical protein